MEELEHDEGFQKFLETEKETETVDEVIEGATEPALGEAVSEEPVAEVNSIQDFADKHGFTVEEVEKATKEGYRIDQYDPSDPYRKTPVEFNRLGNVIDKFEKAVKDVRGKDEIIRRMMDKFQKKEEIAYQRAIRELESRRMAAIEEADTEEFRRIDNELNLQKQELNKLQEEVVKVEDNSAHEAALEFQKRNAHWYNSDTYENSKMSEFAIDYENYLANKDPNISVEERLRKVEMEVRKKYINNPIFANRNRDSAPVMSANASKTVAPKSVELTANQERMYRHMKSVNPKYTKEQYLKDME